MANVLQNAFKFTRPHGSVRLRAHATADRVLIDVEDECGGLPPESWTLFFAPSPNTEPIALDSGLAFPSPAGACGRTTASFGCATFPAPAVYSRSTCRGVPPFPHRARTESGTFSATRIDHRERDRARARSVVPEAADQRHDEFEEHRQEDG